MDEMVIANLGIFLFPPPALTIPSPLGLLAMLPSILPLNTSIDCRHSSC